MSARARTVELDVAQAADTLLAGRLLKLAPNATLEVVLDGLRDERDEIGDSPHLREARRDIRDELARRRRDGAEL